MPVSEEIRGKEAHPDQKIPCDFSADRICVAVRDREARQQQTETAKTTGKKKRAIVRIVPVKNAAGLKFIARENRNPQFSPCRTNCPCENGGHRPDKTRQGRVDMECGKITGFEIDHSRSEPTVFIPNSRIAPSLNRHQ